MDHWTVIKLLAIHFLQRDRPHTRKNSDTEGLQCLYSGEGWQCRFESDEAIAPSKVAKWWIL